MPDFTGYVDKYFKADHVKEPVRLTIANVVLEQIGQDKETKPVARFQEDPRGLVLNTSKYNELAEAHKSANTDFWIGAVVELSYDPDVKFGSKKVGGTKLRIVRAAVLSK